MLQMSSGCWGVLGGQGTCLQVWHNLSSTPRTHILKGEDRVLNIDLQAPYVGYGIPQINQEKIYKNNENKVSRHRS